MTALLLQLPGSEHRNSACVNKTPCKQQVNHGTQTRASATLHCGLEDIHVPMLAQLFMAKNMHCRMTFGCFEQDAVTSQVAGGGEIKVV